MASVITVIWPAVACSSDCIPGEGVLIGQAPDVCSLLGCTVTMKKDLVKALGTLFGFCSGRTAM